MIKRNSWTPEQGQAIQQFGHDRNKYGAGRRADVADPRGKHPYFRSTWEANYARYLNLLLLGKRITDWEYEPETFYFEGIRRGATNFKPDFKVTRPDGTSEYHEVKGWMDSRSKTKLKRMAKYHPTARIVVVDLRAYKAIEERGKIFVPGWE